MGERLPACPDRVEAYPTLTTRRFDRSHPFPPHNPITLASFRQFGTGISLPGLPRVRHRAKLRQVHDRNRWRDGTHRLTLIVLAASTAIGDGDPPTMSPTRLARAAFLF